MTETSPNTPRSMTESDVIDETTKQAYYTEKIAAIQRGEPIWVRRNFDDDSAEYNGGVHDYYKDRKHLGLIDSTSRGHNVYAHGQLNEEPLASLDDAKALLEQYTLQQSANPNL